MKTSYLKKNMNIINELTFIDRINRELNLNQWAVENLKKAYSNIWFGAPKGLVSSSIP